MRVRSFFIRTSTSSERRCLLMTDEQIIVSRDNDIDAAEKW